MGLKEKEQRLTYWWMEVGCQSIDLIIVGFTSTPANGDERKEVEPLLDRVKKHINNLMLKGWIPILEAAKPLMECSEELIIVHRLCVPPLLRKTLHSTNPIGSMFSQVSQKMGRIKSMKKGKIAQRWVATALLEAERNFRTVKGHLQIHEVKDRIKLLQREQRAEVN